MAGGLENLDTVEPLAKRVERHAYDRLIMLADGVFAIALTLAALEMRVPPGWDGTWRGLVGLVAKPLGVYAVSFALIGIYWMANRAMMARLRRVDAPFTALVLLFLAMIALLPAANRFLIDASGPRSGPAFLVYLGAIVLLGMIQSAAWGYAAYIGRLMLPEVTGRYRAAHLVSSFLTPPAGYVITSLIYASPPGPRLWAGIAAAVGLLAARRWLLGAWVDGAAPKPSPMGDAAGGAA